jgi:hypothetical protein
MNNFRRRVGGWGRAAAVLRPAPEEREVLLRELHAGGLRHVLQHLLGGLDADAGHPGLIRDRVDLAVLDGREGLPDRVGGDLLLLGLVRGVGGGDEDQVGVGLVDLLGADVLHGDGGIVRDLRLGPLEADVVQDDTAVGVGLVQTGRPGDEADDGGGRHRVAVLLLDGLAERLGAGLVLLQLRRGLALQAERLGVHLQVGLPGAAGGLGEDGRGDGTELVVDLLVPDLRGQDQIGLQGGDLLQVGLQERADVGGAAQLALQIRREAALGLEVRGDRADRVDAEQGDVVQLTGVEHHDPLRLRRDLDVAHHGLEGARETGRRGAGGLRGVGVAGLPAAAGGQDGRTEHDGQQHGEEPADSAQGRALEHGGWSFW